MEILHITAVNPSGILFGCKGKEVLISKYQSVSYRYLSFCWRVYRIRCKEAYERWASLLYNITGELEGVVFSSSYNSSFCSSREREVDKSDSDIGSDEDNDSSKREVDNKDIAALPYSILNRAVFLFISALIKVYISGNMYMNVLLSFCIVLGIR
ncbi:unnamed protein product [Clonostachys chloroleuca]|uniref:Uncharacterized protein n=1 Tax=Clonostachys chloroleuca TaxID=1926264 RepID=A0AA35MIN6_9HYPO|nr:unnamed protein product [Clonostachys chloroleuca]